MSYVNYGDQFYLFAYDENDPSGSNGWITISKDDNNYYILCLSCATDSTKPSVVPYTILPGNQTNGCDPSNDYGNFSSPVECDSNNGNSTNVVNTPVGTDDYFYIGRISAISSKTWASDSIYMGIHTNYGDLKISQLTDHPENSDLQAQNIENSSNNYFVYGQTTFNLATPNNQTGNMCHGNYNKRSPFSKDTDNDSDGGQHRITTEYNGNVCSTYSVLRFVFVPVNAYTMSGSNYTPINIKQYTYSNVGQPLYSTNTPFYGCISNVCIPGTGVNYKYNSLSDCNSGCGYVAAPMAPQPPGSLQYPPTPNNLKYGCINGSCTTGTGSNYNYSTFSDCQTNCKSQSNTWIYIVVIAVFIIIILILLGGGYYFIKKK
jgi:hypothetical protein